jgi:hypothetical protein
MTFVLSRPCLFASAPPRLGGPPALRAPRCIGVALLLSILVLSAPRAAFVDAVLAEVDTAIVTASDVALARALGTFDLGPSAAPITAAEVQRYTDARLLAREAEQLAIEVPADAIQSAWQAAGRRAGGTEALAAWLGRMGLSAAWARAVVTADERRRRYLELRFRSFAFVSEFDVNEALGPGPHTQAEREAARRRLLEDQVEQSLAEWLAETRARTRIRMLITEPVPVPLPMP